MVGLGCVTEVPSGSQEGQTYRVKLGLAKPELPELWCSCSDHRYRGPGCRHACAVLWRLIAQQEQEAADKGLEVSPLEAPLRQRSPQGKKNHQCERRPPQAGSTRRSVIVFPRRPRRQ